MTMLTKVYVGVDVSKKYLDIHLYPIKKKLHIENTNAGLIKLIDLLAQYDVQQVVCESTGNYERLLMKYLIKEGHNVWRIEPKRIKAFIFSEGIRAKTDRIDAQMIALFAAKKSCSYTPIVQTDQEEKIRNLVSLKDSYIVFAAEIKTKLHQAYEKECIQSLKRQLRSTEKEIQKLEAKIKLLIKENEHLEKKAKIISSIPGVGKGTIETTLAMLPELGIIENKQVSSLCGVAPYVKQSGLYKGKSRIGGGRSDLRKILYMAAVSAIQHNAKLKIFYQRLIKAGKPFKVAIVAVMRKLLIYMNTLVKKNEVWNPIM